MNKVESVYLILTNYIMAVFIISIGGQMIPVHLFPMWYGFNAYLWLVSPFLILWADMKEKEKTKHEKPEKPSD